MYWLKDEVWSLIPDANEAAEPEFSLCIPCAEQRLGRHLTLDDLSIQNYLLTELREIPFRKEYAMATLCGALTACEMPLPDEWTLPSELPFTHAASHGEKLAKQTISPRSALESLIHDFHTSFGEVVPDNTDMV